MKIFTRKVGAMPRHRGLPRRRQLHLGEPGDNIGGLSGSPR